VVRDPFFRNDSSFNVSLEDMKKLAEKHKWMHELDEDVMIDHIPQPLDYGLPNERIPTLEKQLIAAK
jgi:hypothetical protein